MSGYGFGFPEHEVRLPPTTPTGVCCPGGGERRWRCSSRARHRRRWRSRASRAPAAMAVGCLARNGGVPRCRTHQRTLRSADVATTDEGVRCLNVPLRHFPCQFGDQHSGAQSCPRPRTVVVRTDRPSAKRTHRYAALSNRRLQITFNASTTGDGKDRSRAAKTSIFLAGVHRRSRRQANLERTRL